MSLPAGLLLIVAAAIAVAAGCGPTTRHAYTKAGVTPDQRARDEAECERLSWVTQAVGSHEPRGFSRERFTRCMIGHGYELHTVRD